MAATERELLELFDAARKAAESAVKSGNPADIDRCVNAIHSLGEVPVTVKVLVDTQVGRHLKSRLTKHPLEKIQKAASDLCGLWKKKVIEDTFKKKEGSSSAKGLLNNEDKSERAETMKLQKARTGTAVSSRSDSAKVEKNETNERMKFNNLDRGVSMKAEKARLDHNSGVNGITHTETIKTDKNTKEEKRSSTANWQSSATNQPPKLVSMVKCNDAVRDKNRELFAEALSKVYAEAQDFREQVEACDPIRTAILLESVMFEKLGRSSGAHKQKYRSILFNLKDQNNPDLRRRVLLGEIKPENLINMPAEEMASDQRKLQNKQIKEKALFECERGMAPKASTDQFKCGRCGQRKCTYYQMQTRSADEPMTTFVTCVNCNNHWKFC